MSEMNKMDKGEFQNESLIDLNTKIERQIDAETCTTASDVSRTNLKFNSLKNQDLNNNTNNNNMPSNINSSNDEVVIMPQKHESQKHSHIPYILNGELYKIQTQKGENVTVKCCNCPPDRVYRGSVRSTGNFHMHIKRRHPHLMSKLHEMKVHALLERRDRLIKHRSNKSPPLQSIFHRRSLPTQTLSNIVKDQETIDFYKLKEKETIFIQKNTIIQSSPSTSSNAGTLGNDQVDGHNNWHSSSPTSLAANNKCTDNNNKLFDKIKPEIHSTNPSAPIDLSKSHSNAHLSANNADNRQQNRIEDHSHLLCQIANEMSPTNTKEMLVHLSDTLQGIQRAMCVRNQLESNRLLFDVSKFKYLHPDFVFEF